MTAILVQQALDLAAQLQAAGDPAKAEHLYQLILTQEPNHSEALHWLGLLAYQAGRNEVAVEFSSRAIALTPDFAPAYLNLGNALGMIHRPEEAIAAYRRAIELEPASPEPHNNLANSLTERGRFDEAIAAYRTAISLKPDYAEAYSNLGHALMETGQCNEAIAACRQAIALAPERAGAHNNLGVVLRCLGLLDDAVAAYRRAIALEPDHAEAHNNLASALQETGQLREAIALYRRAIASRPDFPQAGSNLAYALHFDPGCDARAIAEEHRRWNRQHAVPLQDCIPPHLNDPTPDRRLRIGYVSPDFGDHPVGRFFGPLLEHHDPAQIEVFAYYQDRGSDETTARLRSRTDEWRSIRGQSDAQVADLVRRDKIDILVDLAMHTAQNRLLVFARKPAPVQVTYLAYCSSTGLATIDYRLSDPYLDPPEIDESIYSEKTVRLPETYWCYPSPGAVAAEVNALPALQQGFVTFGCLNKFGKVSEPVVAAWVELLRAIPAAKLLLHVREGTHRRRLLARFEQGSVDPARIRLADQAPRHEYFRLYHEIDIALDTFPYGGGTTTCDALWMGVPVVSLVGKTGVGRGGLSILSNIGLPQLAVRSSADYVRLAMQLAGDLPRLNALRGTLRQRMLRSPLMDAPRFARNIEAAYRRMWRNWCGNGQR